MSPGAGWDPRESLRLCSHRCAVIHYENCTGCFGFGVFDTPNMKGVPVTAAEAMDGLMLMKPEGPGRPCPVCRSTTKGVPT